MEFQSSIYSFLAGSKVADAVGDRPGRAQTRFVRTVIDAGRCGGPAFVGIISRPGQQTACGGARFSAMRKGVVGGVTDG